MIPIAIKIGAVEVFNVTNFRTKPDDRQSTLETIGGIVVQDFGRVEKGDKISFSADIKATDKDTLFFYWNNRLLVTVIDEANQSYDCCRVKVIDYGYVKPFVKYVNLNLEIWRV